MAGNVLPESPQEADGPQAAEDNQTFVQKLHELGLLTKNNNIYSMILRDETHGNSLFRTLAFGDEFLHKTNKVIMLVGETGAGKSTHINAIVNYIMGIKLEDRVRVKLVEEETASQAQSQTTQVNVYKINHMEGFKVPHSLTIIDTPGFGHTDGIEYDQQIVQQITQCFAPGSGVDHIDVIGFVIKATVTRLTALERKKPTVVDILHNAPIRCARYGYGLPIFFKFNNSSIPVRNSSSEDEDAGQDAEESHWKMGMENMEKFFDFLPTRDTQSLILTREVLKERHCLEVTLKGMEAKNKEALLNMAELEKVENLLRQNEALIENNGDFTYEINETKVRKVCTEKNAMNCHECSSTCHHPCLVSLDTFAYFCEVFYWDATCKICGHDKSSHFSEKHKWETYVEPSTTTYSKLIRKYQGASLARIQEILREEIQQAEKAGLHFIAEAKKMINRLHEIALKPDLLSTADYIELLISNERSDCRAGFTERINSLEKLKRRTLLLHEMMEKDNA
uniref:Septin-type G domain-containing protein n=1 Tax=Leptobrachium leishanense TaxID=445787 RepID=A0A8C5QUQ5_9ANUR